MATGVKVSGSGVGFGSLLAVLFIGLKLTGYINWSWIWVLCPLWIGFAIAALVLVVPLLLAAIVGLTALIVCIIQGFLKWHKKTRLKGNTNGTLRNL